MKHKFPFFTYTSLSVFLTHLLCIFFHLSAHAQFETVSLEQFNGNISMTATVLQNHATGWVTEAQSLRGRRKLYLQHTGGALNVNLTSNNGVMTFSQDSLTNGTASVVWDGTTNTSVFSPIGLNNFNLGERPYRGFIIRIASFNFAFNKSIDLVFTVYDGGDPTGNKFSRGRLTINQSLQNKDVYLPFDQVSNAGPFGMADFTKVGAIRMDIDTKTATGLSLAIDSVSVGCTTLNSQGLPICDIASTPCGQLTPGASCTRTPTATPTLTPCITLTPTRTPTATPTRTPTLTPSRTPTLTPSPSPSRTASATPSPSCTPTVTSSPTQTRTPTTTASPSPTQTNTPVFSPSSTPSPSPSEAPSNTPTNTTTATSTPEPKDCLGIINGNAVVDECGECNGNNSNKGCDGICFSRKVVDKCGICGGDDKSCNFNAQCVEQALSPEIVAGANNVKRTSNLIIQRARNFSSQASRCKSKRARTDLSRAETLNREINTMIDSKLTTRNFICPNTVCTTISCAPTIRTLNKLAGRLFSLQRGIKLEAIRACKIKPKNNKADKRKRSEDYYNDLADAIDKLPRNKTECITK
jgi:hypothetical protein